MEGKRKKKVGKHINEAQSLLTRPNNFFVQGHSLSSLTTNIIHITFLTYTLGPDLRLPPTNHRNSAHHILFCIIPLLPQKVLNPRKLLKKKEGPKPGEEHHLETMGSINEQPDTATTTTSSFFTGTKQQQQQHPELEEEGGSFHIPTIDVGPFLADPASEAAARVVARVRAACTTTGFFSLVGHDIPRRVQDDVLGAAKRLFALPLDEKRALRHPRLRNRGYELIGAQALQDGTLPDLKEVSRLAPPNFGTHF